MNILVINSGSSSLKFQLINPATEEVITKGGVDGIGLEICKVKIDGTEDVIFLENHKAALNYVLERIDKSQIEAVGHRVVHGGEYYSSPAIVDETLIKRVTELSELAPLHNPANIQGIIACQEVLPGVKQVAVFDTAYHQTIPPKAYMYGIPYEYYERHKIRKYGFHGTSHKYIMQKTRDLLNKDPITMISCHIGNGSSIAAIKDNLSVDTSMGFTPLPGIVMGTRCGDIDPEIVSYLETKEGLSPNSVKNILNTKSGLLGVSGSSDMRIIYQRAEEGDFRAKLAIDILAYDIAKYVAAYAGILGPVDAITFTAGLGENAFYLREKVIHYFNTRDVSLDVERNKRNETVISTLDSVTKVLVIPTNEELMIAKETANVLTH
ncbi:acetate kinase [Candidatus Woesearchaeota archaeon]|nr:acetate kinase [Candidatus Woesearchaeota archaeon]